MAAKKKTTASKKTAAKKPTPKSVPGTNREHRMIDARESREAVKRRRVNGV